MSGKIIESPSFEILQKVLDAAREGVLIVDRDLRVTRCNRPAAAAFGRADLDLVTRRLSEIGRNLELHDAFSDALVKSVSGDVKIEVRRNGTRTFDVHVAPIEVDGEGFAIGFFYETTQIERLETVRQEFLSNISHELRTPLTSILTFAETLLDGGINDPENNIRFLEIIKRNAGRMQDLIADILELSLIESGAVVIDKRPVNLAELVDDIFTSLASKAAERQIELINQVEPGSEVFADPVRLEQMLINLIDNAVKFNRPAGSVIVSLQVADDNSVVTVADTGEGIFPEHAERIFERLYRADRSRSREIGGTGLGLAIVKHLARLQGGEVSMSSVLGSGSAFSVTLPR